VAHTTNKAAAVHFTHPFRTLHLGGKGVKRWLLRGYAGSEDGVVV
jgi:hypothetical protein